MSDPTHTLVWPPNLSSDEIQALDDPCVNQSVLLLVWILAEIRTLRASTEALLDEIAEQLTTVV